MENGIDYIFRIIMLSYSYLNVIGIDVWFDLMRMI